MNGHHTGFRERRVDAGRRPEPATHPRDAVPFQPCARCGARWTVVGSPLYWCPRCRGVLLSPAAVAAPPQRRNYRWVARAPGRRPRPGVPTGDTDASAAEATNGARQRPHYRDIPRWGLHEPSRPQAAAAPARTRWAALTERLTTIVVATTALFFLAAVAELGRYLLLLHSRTRLTSNILLLISDLAVLLTSGLALLAALLAATAGTGWLVRRRRAGYAALGQRDPRPVWMVLIGCLIPVVNLVCAGVFLTELARLPSAAGSAGTAHPRPRGRRRDCATSNTPDERIARAVRIWWVLWVVNGVMVAAALWWHTATTVQARANGVLFAVYTDLVAAAVALASLWLVHVVGDRDLWGRARLLTRWVPVTAPVVRSKQEEVVAQ